MSAGILNLVIEQGATFERTITLEGLGASAIDATGWTFRGQIRKKFSDPNILASFTVTIINASIAQFRLSLTDVETSAIPVKAATSFERTSSFYTHDVEAVKPDGTVLRVLQGSVEISPEVTK